MAYRRLEKVSSWRRLAVGMWGPPSSPTAQGMREVDLTKTIPFMQKVSEKTGQKITVTHMFVAAMGRVLAAYPEYNVILRRNVPYQRDTCDVFVQVAIKGADGRADLSGIKIERADTMTVEEIAAKIAARAQKVRAGRDKDIEKAKGGVARIPPMVLRPTIKALTSLSYDFNLDLSFLGIKKDPFGAAMITNVGGFGIPHALVPLLPTSRIGILFCLGMIHDRPHVIDGKVEVRPTLILTGSMDHRVLDGFQIGNITVMLDRIVANPEEHDLTQAFQ